MSICGYRSKWIFDDLRCPSTGKRTAKIMITTNNDDDVLSIRTNRARVTIEPTELGWSVWCRVRAARHWYGYIDIRRHNTSMIRSYTHTHTYIHTQTRKHKHTHTNTIILSHPVRSCATTTGYNAAFYIRTGICITVYRVILFTMHDKRY